MCSKTGQKKMNTVVLSKLQDIIGGLLKEVPQLHEIVNAFIIN